jgi:Tol biopolymer transport system component
MWLRGGKSAVYSTGRGRPPHLFRRDLTTGKEEELVPGGGFQMAQDVSPDGRTLVYSERTDRGPFDIWMLPLSGQAKPTALLQSPFNKDQVRFSPDGRFIAFISDESGKPEIYLMSYPGSGERIRVSTGGARLLRWSREDELLFLSSDLRMTSVPVRTSPSLQLGAPTTLFALKGDPWVSFDVSPDGKRFLAIVPEVVADQLPLTVVVNWTSEVEK